MKDPNLEYITNYKELLDLIDDHFIQGTKSNLTEKEEIIKEGK